MQALTLLEVMMNIGLSETRTKKGFPCESFQHPGVPQGSSEPGGGSEDLSCLSAKLLKCKESPAQGEWLRGKVSAIAICAHASSPAQLELEDGRAQEDRSLQESLFILKERHIAVLKRLLKAQKQQAAVVAQVVEITKEDCLMVDFILDLVVSFVPLAVQPLAMTLHGPGPACPLAGAHSPALSPQWAWDKVQHHLQWLEPPASTPEIGPLEA
ncbi:hypothetical protein Y1Q_0017902 [Alligator mississippiensis]|uniref:Uncharacterized protein n=1 Tax=Alligator mississippiensis TaxID=8496 RepID=A0A151MXK6_ALLMI|nr:hypothetical protein Y1Q_0017902 [Alligator mississippiensis]